MAITVKKTKKTLTLRSAKSDPEDTGEAALEEGTGGEQALAPPPAAYASAQPGGQSFTVAAVLALIATVLFLVLLAIQGREWSYYHQPPSAFPVKTGP